MRSKVALVAALLSGIAMAGQARAAEPDTRLWRDFLSPPAEARPMMRWWWFGPAVTNSELDREIRAMKAAGFGGFEVQPTYPLSPDDEKAGIKNLAYLSDDFIAALRHAGETARAEVMRIDVTGGSGWPFGGPHIPVDQAAANVRMERRIVAARATELQLPALGPGERMLAAMIGPRALAADAARPLQPLPIDQPRVALDMVTGEREALIFIAGRTGQTVKRPAVGAEGFVLDHIDPQAVRNHLATVGDRLLEAFRGVPMPYAIFSDSLEAYGSSWTGDLPEQFRRRRGYDLIDRLPALFLDTPDAAAVRFDWARTLSELVDERYLAPIDAWAKAHGTRFRAQVYGFPPPTLSSNALVALPEGEGADWRSFTSTRWATSAAHLYGRPVVSSEVWTWLHSPAWAATPLDMKLEADRHFLQGVTQLVGHGWPYTPPGVAEPGWSFYAAAALNDHNPWFGAMPDVTRYLQRVSFMLRQGVPANAVAVYLPTEDAFADMRPERASVNEEMSRRVPAELIARVLDSGQGFDFIDAGAIRARGIHHKVLILPPMTRIDPDAYRLIADWVAAGGTLITVDTLPTQAGGLIDGPHEGAAVVALSKRLTGDRRATLTTRAGLTDAVVHVAGRDMALASPDPAIGFIHRTLPQGDLYFVVNTGNRPVATIARFAADRGNGTWWDPMTGTRWSAGTGEIALRLAPYESRMIVFAGTTGSASSVAGGPSPDRETKPAAADISTGWAFSIAGRPERMLEGLASWADDPALRYFSGSARYRRTITLGAPMVGQCVAIGFGPTVALAAPANGRPRAMVAAPVRDAAIVTVNGVRAGSVWAPPYRLDITRLLRPGRNSIELSVSNTALNSLAGRAPPDYRLLSARYGERFQPQDNAAIAPAPSGLIGSVTLLTTAGCRGATSRRPGANDNEE